MTRLDLAPQEPKVPYFCTLSTRLRLVMNVTSSSAHIQNLKGEVAALVNQIDKNEEVAKSLKAPYPAKNGSYWRQCDMKDVDEKIVFKAFVRWYPPKECWHVFIEFADENEFETNGCEINAKLN